jgi:predicted O-methyltransferase YrrM
MVKPGLMRAVRTLRALREHVCRPPWVRPGHFYSPTTSQEDIDRALSWNDNVAGVDLREAEQLDLFKQLAPRLSEAPQDRYQSGNNMYDVADAAFLHAMLCYLRPRRVIEVGSGHSTAMLLDTAERQSIDINVTCIEPYPDRLLKLLRPDDAVELVRNRVQDVSLTIYDTLKAGDILLIDSTHVAKAGSDVLWLFLRVLPRLSPGVVVHVHDVFWPFEYPETWLREGRDWNEAYLLQAFLCHNSGWDILLFSSWLWQTRRQLLPQGLQLSHPGAFWMQRKLRLLNAGRGS